MIVLFKRKAFPGQFSIENVFSTLIPIFQRETEIELQELSYSSTGLIKRFFAGWEANRKQGKVNHITGDINFIALFLNKRKTILTIHDCDFILRSKGVKRFFLYLFWLYLPIRRVSYITVISEATKKELLNLVRIPEQKLIVIPNPLTLVNKPLSFKRHSVPKKPTLLQIGTKKNKNLENLIKAISTLNVRLEIIGKLTEYQLELLLRYQIDFHASEKLTERQLVTKYQETDLLTFLSTREGFGLPIIEANSLGCPVITSNLSSMPEVAGEAAILVDPYSLEDIRAAIRRVITDKKLREDLIQKGFQNVQRFHPETVAQKYLELYYTI